MKPRTHSDCTKKVASWLEIQSLRLMTTLYLSSKYKVNNSGWKSPKMSHMSYSILVFFTNFCQIKTDLSGNAVWPQASSFKKLAQMDHFRHFWFKFCPFKKCKSSSLRSPCLMRLFLYLRDLSSSLIMASAPLSGFSPQTVFLFSSKKEETQRKACSHRVLIIITDLNLKKSATVCASRFSTCMNCFST